jgi:hypothetical protein
MVERPNVFSKGTRPETCLPACLRDTALCVIGGQLVVALLLGEAVSVFDLKRSRGCVRHGLCSLASIYL